MPAGFLFSISRGYRKETLIWNKWKQWQNNQKLTVSELYSTPDDFMIIQLLGEPSTQCLLYTLENAAFFERKITKVIYDQFEFNCNKKVDFLFH